jgi:hypothetical protein
MSGPARTAILSEDGVYRYSLTRTFTTHKHPVVFCMLNPSTADADIDDPTIRRCMRFARDWGYGGLVVVNLFALRATDPVALHAHDDPVGPLNMDHIGRAADSRDVIVAWGANPATQYRDATVTQLLRRKATTVRCLGVTKEGHPRHPLYVSAATVPTAFFERSRA